jgi:hypothetical protein
MANFSDLIEPLLKAGCLQQHPDVATTLVAALALLDQRSLDRRSLSAVPQLRGPSQLVASLVRDRCR